MVVTFTLCLVGQVLMKNAKIGKDALLTKNENSLTFSLHFIENWQRCVGSSTSAWDLPARKKEWIQFFNYYESFHPFPFSTKQWYNKRFSSKVSHSNSAKNLDNWEPLLIFSACALVMHKKYFWLDMSSITNSEKINQKRPSMKTVF